MSADTIHTHRDLPVLLGPQQHVMAKADIFRTPQKVLIQIEADNDAAQFLAEFLEQPEIIGLSFVAVPVQNIREKRETN